MQVLTRRQGVLHELAMSNAVQIVHHYHLLITPTRNGYNAQRSQAVYTSDASQDLLHDTSCNQPGRLEIKSARLTCDRQRGQKGQGQNGGLSHRESILRYLDQLEDAKTTVSGLQHDEQADAESTASVELL
jgi:hypothetical protein